MVKNYLRTGIGLVGAGTMVGSIPNLTGTAGETSIRTGFSQGLGKVGGVLPTIGKIKGTEMVLKPFSKLKKKTKQLKFKGAYEL